MCTNPSYLFGDSRTLASTVVIALNNEDGWNEVAVTIYSFCRFRRGSFHCFLHTYEVSRAYSAIGNPPY
uniref:Uncharacterized protein n=1 Tax=Utricularia reniformis TaxID=192314 RepID=A0A1Y0B2J4_9LAMI|nr:hypothetical protein AEK19_MT1426 [Utricularia reniformis]ART31620.1 hypothetical protein AEK19_MT1426 [Utricularia reniformis]